MSDEKLLAFGQAVTSAIARSGKKQMVVAAEIGVSDSALSTWKLGQAKPDPDLVFALERAVGAEPGTLSVYLGYIPADVLGNWLLALRNDPDVPAGLREVILLAVETWGQ